MLVADRMKGENATMDFNGKSEFRELGDIVPVDLIEPKFSIEKTNVQKAVALLKEALEVLEKEQ